MSRHWIIIGFTSSKYFIKFLAKTSARDEIISSLKIESESQGLLPDNRIFINSKSAVVSRKGRKEFKLAISHQGG